MPRHTKTEAGIRGWSLPDRTTNRVTGRGDEDIEETSRPGTSTLAPAAIIQTNELLVDRYARQICEKRAFAIFERHLVLLVFLEEFRIHHCGKPVVAR